YNYSAVRVAVVGCGNWGKNLIRVYHELGALKAVCDIDQDKMAQYQSLGVQRLSFSDILNSDIDAIIIATPSATHYDLALKALEAKKHVFVEKPISHHIEHALHLKETALYQQRKLMVGHLLQYHPAYLKLKSLKQDGVLGDLQYIIANRFNFGKFATEHS